MPKNINEKDLISKLRDRLTDVVEVDTIVKDDATLKRFLHARSWDVSAAEKLFRRDVDWRLSFEPHKVECTGCLELPGKHTLRQVGFDLQRRPVLYTNCYNYGPVRPVSKEIIEHIVYTVENAIRSMPPGVNHLVLVSDCIGMRNEACPVLILKETIQLMLNHYPDRLGLALVVRPGRVFKVIWTVIKRLLPNEMRQKIALITNIKQQRSTLDQYFPNPLAGWLETELNFNCIEPIKARYRPFWLLPKRTPLNDEAKHDPRGSPDYVADWLSLTHPSGHLPYPNIVTSLKAGGNGGDDSLWDQLNYVRSIESSSSSNDQDDEDEDSQQEGFMNEKDVVNLMAPSSEDDDSSSKLNDVVIIKDGEGGAGDQSMCSTTSTSSLSISRVVAN